jgi:sporadic carbohydrate cluster 2OG-Fe(II) oxygenase
MNLVPDLFEEDFYRNGYAVVELRDPEYLIALERSLRAVFDLKGGAIDRLHDLVQHGELNRFRLSYYGKINSLERWEQMLYAAYRHYIDVLIGPDVAVQLKLNPSIQMPGDSASVLELHTDCLSGQSEFECVLWTPLTACRSTNSMYIFNKDKTDEILLRLPDFEKLGMNAVLEEYKSDAKFLELDPGQGVLFSSTLLHGNVINETQSTRVSVNCRVKSLFAPEFERFPTERRLGTFYKMLRSSALTRRALSCLEDGIVFK